MKNGLEPQLQTRFEKDVRDLFAERKFAHIGNSRYSVPLFEGDKVNGLEIWNAISKKARKDGKYYLFTDEIEIIRNSLANKLKKLIQDDVGFVDFGVGAKEAIHDKVGYLIKHLKDKIIHYIGVDSSQEVLEKAKEIFKQNYPTVSFSELKQDFFQEKLDIQRPGQRLLAVIFGQTLFNVPTDPRDTKMPYIAVKNVLEKIKSNFKSGDYLVVPQDCNKDIEDIKAASQEQEEVWVNLLYRMQRDLKITGNFEPDGFAFEPYWINEGRTISYTYVVQKPMTFKIGKEAFSLRKGQRFFLHNTYKFPVDTFRKICRQAGWNPIWTDINEKGRMACHILQIS